MKEKTAVEFLMEKLQSQGLLPYIERIDELVAFREALTMEKQQMNKCYSEEEVIDLLQKMNDWPTICEGRSDIEEWFEQFKKK